MIGRLGVGQEREPARAVLRGLVFVFLATGLCADRRPATAASNSHDAESRYRQAVALFARGSEREALANLHRLTSEVEQSAETDLSRLRETELEVAQSLLASSPETLVPLIALHERALLDRLQGAATHLQHARAVMLALTDLYSAHTDGIEGRQTAGDLFASLAGYFRQTSSVVSGVELYRRALEVDRSNEAALVGIATASEQRGRYDQALPFLRRLVAAHPDYHEGRLRLAINLARSNQRAHALALLEGLEDRAAPKWVQVLGYQERARILLQLGNMNEAWAALRRGLRRFPRDSELMIMLAYVEERQGREPHARDLVLALQTTTSEAGVSPRFLYGQDPVAPLQRARQRIHTYAESQLPVLARAIALPNPGTDG